MANADWISLFTLVIQKAQTEFLDIKLERYKVI